MIFPSKAILVILLTLSLTTGLVSAGSTTLSPDGGHSNQNQINKALEQGNVYLNPGVYEIDDNIILPSNRVLTGDPNAIVRVWGGSSAWFTGLKGVINNGNTVVHDVEISGFQIDGNIGSLPKSYADSRPDTDHDQQKLIILHGYSNQFASNITIKNMKLYNSFSDGVYVLFGDHVVISNNFISNTQHEGVYISCVNYGLVSGNKIAGICSDCGRLDNCQNCKVTGNYFFSYNGESYGQYKGGQAGLQIANSGSSHGYNAANKPQFTDKIEVCYNVFADPGRQAIWLHNYDGSVYVHHNEFKDAEGLETLGIPVGDISVDNPPTVEMSEKVFSSIFDILDTPFTETGFTNQTSDDIQYSVQKTTVGKIAGGVKIVGFTNQIVINNTVYIPNKDSVLVKHEEVLASSNSILSTGVDKIDKNLIVNIENGVATAELEVTIKWFKISKTPGAEHKKVYHTSKARFNDSCVSPTILPQSDNVTAYVDIYQSETYPRFTITVPNNQYTQRIEYIYGDEKAVHTFLMGETKQDKKGVKYTLYSNVDIKEGNFSSIGNTYRINGVFNPEKLKIVYHTPYDSIEVKDVKVTLHPFEKDTWIIPQAGFILRLFILVTALILLFLKTF